ncbi:MAG TPA: uroporphyrinogen-III synthase [Acidimicrobiales bacterium]|nr:uroporphyrinogen-III synthase [Acidimicrobiales bacterium]
MGAESANPEVVVAVTRPRAQAGSLVTALETAGLSTVVVPLIETVPVRDGLAALDRALLRPPGPAWVVVTSANAAGSLLAAVSRTGVDPETLRVAAVGPATARVLTTAGVPVALVPPEHTAAALVEALGAPSDQPDQPDSSGNRVLFPVSAIAPPGPAEELARAGWDVQRFGVYRTHTRSLSPADLAGLATADVVTLTSGSAARAYVSAMGPDPGPLVVTIGPSTTAVARDLGLGVAAEADPHTVTGMTAAVSRLVASGALGRSNGQ